MKRSPLMRPIFGAGLAAFLLASTVAPSLEAQTVAPLVVPASNTHHVGKFVWFDLVTSDVEAAASFYSQVLGWQLERVWGISDYISLTANGRRIGGITPAENPGEVGWIGSLSVENVDKATVSFRSPFPHAEDPSRRVNDPSESAFEASPTSRSSLWVVLTR